MSAKPRRRTLADVAAAAAIAELPLSLVRHMLGGEVGAAAITECPHKLRCRTLAVVAAAAAAIAELPLALPCCNFAELLLPPCLRSSPHTS